MLITLILHFSLKMIYPNNLDRNVRGNSVDPDQTAPQEQSDQGLHVLLVVA